MTTAMDRDGRHQQRRQCRRGASADVELHAAMALADMAGVDHAALPAQHHRHHAAAAAVAVVPPTPEQAAATEHEDEELASTRLSLELGNVGIHSSPCSSSSSGAGQQPPHAASASAAVTGYGTSRPRNMLTEAEKEAKRLRRVLANRESARQTILRRQAIRDELARKVADLASQNENMKKEKDMVLEQYLSLKETNKQLKQQVAKTTKKKPLSTPATTPMDIAPSIQHAEASLPPTPPQPSFLYSGPPPTMPPVPYVWGSWPPCGPGAYEHGANLASATPPPLCLPPACAWYYPVVAAATDPRGSPPSYVQPFQELAGSTGGGGTGAGECTDDEDPCSLTLAIDAADKKSAANAHHSSSAVAGAVGLQVALSGREKEARKRRKELTKLKHMHAGSRHGAGDHW